MNSIQVHTGNPDFESAQSLAVAMEQEAPGILKSFLLGTFLWGVAVAGAIAWVSIS